MNFPNIYFVGKAGAGKTYASAYLVKNYGYVISKFAYPVYNLAYNYFNMKEKDRKLLQFIGTDVGRNLIKDNIWIERFKEDISIVQMTQKQLYNKSISFVADDVRFKNEHKVLRVMGWLGIYLEVSDEKRIERLTKRDGTAQINTLTHSSEMGIEEFKNELIKIDSSGTLDETYENIEKILKKKVKNE